MEAFGDVVLAAGEARRMGQPKQLMPFKGTTLIEHVATNALRSGATEVVVVVGAYSKEIRGQLDHVPVLLTENLRWREGMGGSIAKGLAALSTDIAVITLADQPLVPPEHLHRLAECVSNGSPVAATSYGEVRGAPCAFARSEYPRLLALTGEVGARSLIRDAPHVAVVHLAEAALDVDTPEDYRRIASE